ncbi:MAG TPA: ribosome maturation factor RimP [Gammaproteobacteria bacterium]|nr:ribosome maturation factor RimP [Gammaproteobacteria bacterium]
MTAQDELAELLTPTVKGLGYALLGVERQRTGSGSIVRLYIDCESGIAVEDCARVSRQVGDVLEAEQAVNGEYTLEVSSPGFDRPLFTQDQYRSHIGAEIKVSLRALVNGRRRLSGTLVDATDELVTVRVGGERFDVPYSLVENARLDPRLSERVTWIGD